ncbi:MAG: AAA family ATPase [Rhodobacteraceae bacterium]|nr:AAA family ATPase [Paracoccaceae bacterium]
MGSRIDFSDAPYPGLRPFRPDEADIYFGREAQVDALLGRLQQRRFLAVVGPSGCGKSSLVRAGMIPALETGFMADAGAEWRVLTMTPGDHPLDRLAACLSAQGERSGSEGRQRGDESGDLPTPLTAAALRSGPLGLIDLVRETRLAAHGNLLLVVDQFEEIFRYWEKGDRDEADAFVSLLLASTAQRELPIYVVITMRSDFLGECAVFSGLPEAINDSQYLTPRITREQCQLAIVGPARVFGGSVEPHLVNRLLNDFGPDPDQLPLLQHALMRMWQRARARAENTGQPPLLTQADYTALGGLARALSNHADEVLGELPAAQRAIAEVMFRCLTERGMGRRDTRSPAILADVASVAGVTAQDVYPVVEAFRRPDRSFIVPPSGRPLTPSTLLDIGHESLIRQWRTLGDWVEQEATCASLYQRLKVTARLWQQGEEALLRNPGLERALQWLAQERPFSAWAKRYGSEEEFAGTIAFLRASEQAWSEEQRRQQEAAALEQEQQIARKTRESEQERLKAENTALRNHKRFLSAIAVLVPLLLAAAIGAGWQMKIAKDEAKAKDRAVQAAIAAQEVARAEADRTAQLLERLTNSERTKRAFLTGDIEAIRQLARAAGKSPEMQFGATKTASGWKASDGKPIYRYELYPTPASLAGPLVSASQISYYMAHETFREKLLTAGPANGFAASYQGWGCLTVVYVLVEYADPERPPDVTSYDMCEALGR